MVLGFGFGNDTILGNVINKEKAKIFANFDEKYFKKIESTATETPFTSVVELMDVITD